jgi:AraC-like DNA-binding protein
MVKTVSRARTVLEKAKAETDLDLKSGLISPQQPILVNRRTVPGNPEKRYDLHAYCEIGILEAGGMEKIYVRQTRILRPGNLWWHGPWEPHGWRHRAGNTATIIEFLPSVLYSFPGSQTFYSLLLLPFLRPGVRDRLQPSTREEKEEILRLARIMVREQKERKPGWEELMRITLCELLLRLARKAGDSGSVREQYTEAGRILPVVEYINEHLGEKHYLEGAAKRAGLRRTQFAARFRQIMGINFRQYVRQTRLERARHEIAKGGAKLSYLARQLGFHDASHFYREYRRYFGHAPSRGRK